jgi:hypothetical protein
MEFRMTAFSLRKTPLEPDIKVEGPLQLCRRSTGTVALVCERLSLNCGSVWLSRDMRHRWTEGDGLVDQIIGDDIRSRILTDVQISLGKGTAMEPLARCKDILRTLWLGLANASHIYLVDASSEVTSTMVNALPNDSAIAVKEAARSGGFET